MKLNNKGFAISSIMYLILVSSILLISLTLLILGNRKLVLDRMKDKVKADIYGYYNKDLYAEEILNGSVPVLYSGLTPVKYENNKWVVADVKKSWYSYANQKWANAVILKNPLSKKEGDVVNVDGSSSDVEILGMFVWIPRYEYKIEGQYGKGGVSTTNPGEIEINFISQNQVEAKSGYNIHPGFKFGTANLPGIWVGKFETTGTAASPTVLPNISSLRDQQVAEQFNTSKKFESYVTADTHMMKNSEWGAVAYLSQSKYGKYGNSMYTGANKEIYQNKSSSYTTGSSNGTPSTETTNTQCAYDTLIDRGSGTGSCGGGASTTGNITGVYDMSGGANEYVMGVYDQTIKNSGFSTLPDPKYYDNYANTDVTKACSSGICYGHALSETSGWYGDYTLFVSASDPWFRRGGNYSITSSAGVFNFYNSNGSSTSVYSFRVVVS